MKTKLILLIILLIGFLSYSQNLYKSSIDSGGASVSVGNLQVLFTIGEVAVQETTVADTAISEGFIDSFISGTLNIAENLWNDSKMVIYPNPASSCINISSEISITKVEIFDLLGKRILTSNIQNQIDIRSYQSGLYLIKVYSENGNITKKIIIK